MKSFYSVLLSVFFAALILSCKQTGVGPSQGGGVNGTGTIYYTYVTNDTGFGTVYSINSNGANKQKIIDNAYIYSSPYDSTLVTVQDTAGSIYIVVSDLNGANARKIPINKGVRTILSPKKDKIAYTLISTGGAHPYDAEEVHIINIDGTGDATISQNGAWETFPAWSPDGLKIAYLIKGPFNNYNSQDTLVVVNADGSNPKVFSTNVLGINDGWVSLGWSPDGRTIACTYVENAKSGILLVNADGSGSSKIAEGPGSSTEINREMLSWSSDSKKLVFLDSALSIINSDGTNGRSLFPITPNNIPLFPHWSPDGNLIAYVDMTDPNYFRGPLKVIDISTGNSITLDASVAEGFWGH